MLNNNGLNIGDGLNCVTCERSMNIIRNICVEQIQIPVVFYSKWEKLGILPICKSAVFLTLTQLRNSISN